MELFQLILLAVTTPFALIWLFLAAAKGKKYRQYTNSAFAREFQMSDLFCVGFSVMEILHISTKSRRAQAKIKEISEIKGKQYAEYYYFILLGAKTTYIFTILVFVCLLAVLAASAEALLLGLLLGGLAIAYLDLSLQDKLTARRQELVLDLPQVLSKLTLLVNSGMWEVKKNEVKQKGEKANSRLLLPMMLIFIGILIMILVPVFQQMG